nr:hypothetical protein CFP56_73819 [Quercus suber]
MRAIPEFTSKMVPAEVQNGNTHNADLFTSFPWLNRRVEKQLSRPHIGAVVGAQSASLGKGRQGPITARPFGGICVHNISHRFLANQSTKEYMGNNCQLCHICRVVAEHCISMHYRENGLGLWGPRTPSSRTVYHEYSPTRQTHPSRYSPAVAFSPQLVCADAHVVHGIRQLLSLSLRPSHIARTSSSAMPDGNLGLKSAQRAALLLLLLGILLLEVPQHTPHHLTFPPEPLSVYFVAKVPWI